MSLRLSSVLTRIARACQLEPAPQGAWELSRSLNYPLGLARLTLGVRAGEAVRPVGSILLQAFALADGSSCVKANLAWAVRAEAAPVTHAIYAQPGTDWDAAADLVAARWLAGAADAAPAAVTSLVPVAPSAEEAHELLAAAV